MLLPMLLPLHAAAPPCCCPSMLLPLHAAPPCCPSTLLPLHAAVRAAAPVADHRCLWLLMRLLPLDLFVIIIVVEAAAAAVVVVDDVVVTYRLLYLLSYFCWCCCFCHWCVTAVVYNYISCWCNCSKKTCIYKYGSILTLQHSRESEAAAATAFLHDIHSCESTTIHYLLDREYLHSHRNSLYDRSTLYCKRRKSVTVDGALLQTSQTHYVHDSFLKYFVLVIADTNIVQHSAAQIMRNSLDAQAQNNNWLPFYALAQTKWIPRGIIVFAIHTKRWCYHKQISRSKSEHWTPVACLLQCAHPQ